MNDTASILLNVLERNIHKLLLPSFAPKIVILFNIQLNSKLVYPKKNIVNDHIDYKSKSIPVYQKKGKPILYKRGASFKPDITFLFFISIFWLIN